MQRPFSDGWFSTPVIGARSPHEIALLAGDPFLDDEEAIFSDEDISSAPVPKGATRRATFESHLLPSPRDFPLFESAYPAPKGLQFPWQKQTQPWMHTSHAFGHIASIPGRTELPIRPLSSIRADKCLKNAQVNVTLDRLRVCNYPGKGTHKILIHFYAQHQAREEVQDLHFNSAYRVRQGEQAALRGYPVFIGLAVGAIGLRLRCRTINIGNEDDEAFLACLESDVVKAGLRLVATAQPAIAPLSNIAFGLAQFIGERNRNVAVQDVDLGLDFGTSPMGARLAEGSYLAVQMPEEHLYQWDWNDWVYHAASGQVLLRTDYRLGLPYNYLVFSIRRYEGTEQ